MRSYKQRKKKKEKRNQIIIAILLSFLMIGSMAGIMLNQQNTNKKYNNYKFRSTDQGYLTKVEGKEFYFNYLPQEIEEFKMSKSFCKKLQNSEAIQILFEPETQSAMFIDYIRLNFQQNLNQIIITKITNESTKYSTYDVGSCDDATERMPMIFFKETDNHSITIDNNCLIVESKQNNFLVFRDIILYGYTGIMQGD